MLVRFVSRNLNRSISFIPLHRLLSNSIILRSYTRIKINISDCIPRKIVASYMYNIQSYSSN